MAITKLFVYHVETGRILAAADYDDAGDSGPPGPRAAEFGQVDPVTHYAPNGEITQRPANPVQLDSTVVVADTIATVQLSNVPNPSRVTVQHGFEPSPPFVIEVTDGVLSINFNRAGPYTIKVESFPVQDVQFNIEALAAS